MKKKVHIISHSHLDREWYMPYEQHHMRVVELMDNLLEIFETDPEFKSFHLDGQTIVLDDYLEVRPQNREKVAQAIESGKLKIGPFYILQDDFLISSEANARNALIGMKESKKWGNPVKIGYFPDTFGNMGQTPQMMKQIGIDTATFGRGVKPTGLNNAVIDEQYTSQFSEMNWQGPDGSEILGILFANWYSNGNEIPVDPEKAKIFWQQKLADAEKYASTRHLLMMNGCDHQPLQKNVTEAIRIANELFPDYEFVHSSFEEYMDEVKKELPEELSTVTGELTSQETDGWYTLANTASSRVYLKQKNVQVQAQLENITEPLVTMAAEISGKYPHDELDYAWRLLMQNHPHDSICGCSVDDVHREMMTRYAKAEEVGKYLADEAMTVITDAIDTSSFSEDERPFVVFNTAFQPKQGVLTSQIEWKRRYFYEAGPPRLYKELAEEELPEFEVIDSSGRIIDYEIINTKVNFGYDLPKDSFRVPYMAQVIEIKLFLDEMQPVSWQTFALRPKSKADHAKSETSSMNDQNLSLENEKIRVTIGEDSSLNILDKQTGKNYPNQLIFEDVGDIGHEYVFKQPNGDQALYSTSFPWKGELISTNPSCQVLKLTHYMEIPESADEQLTIEQNAVIDFTNRKAQRSKQTKPFVIETLITLEAGSAQLQFETNYDNQQKDHRLRVLFSTGVQTDKHFAESIFERVERPNRVADSWKNPTNPQHQHSYVGVEMTDEVFVVGNVGLNEYEIIDDTTIALTLLRSVGEMGDWGYFPTPEAQCIGKQTARYSLEVGPLNQLNVILDHTKNLSVPFSVWQTNQHSGKLLMNEEFLKLEPSMLQLTALKYNYQNQLVTRGFNRSQEKIKDLKIKIDGKIPYKSNLLEEQISADLYDGRVNPAEIVTLIWK